MKIIIRLLSILSLVLAMSCSKQDISRTLPTGEKSLADYDIVFDVNMSSYSDDSATAATRGGSATWTDGAEIAFALDGSAKPAGKLKYNAASGKWSKSEINASATVKPSGGTVHAIHANELHIDFAKENAECKGNIVYTKAGTYKIAKDILYFTLSLDTRVESRLVINGVNDKAKVLNVKNKRLKSFADMSFEEYDSSEDGIYDATTKTLTIEGCFPEDASGKTTIEIMYIEGANEGKVMKRIYDKKAGPGQSVSIKGPDNAEQATSWADQGFAPTKIKLKNPETGEYYTDGQELLCPVGDAFALVEVFPENATDKTFTFSCISESGDYVGMVKDSYTRLSTKYAGKCTLTVQASNGTKTTLKIDAIDKSFYVDGFRYTVLLGGGVKLAQPDESGEYYGTVEPAYQGDVVIPANVTYNGREFDVIGIGYYAFDCKDESGILDNNGINYLVTSITMGENITFMDNYAIDNLPNLTKVKINKKLQTPKDIHLITPFVYCNKLATIEIDEGNDYFTVENGVLYCRPSLDLDRHYYCVYVIPQYTLPVTISDHTVKVLKSSVINVQTPSIDIPSSVTDLGMNLFGGADTKLESVTFHWRRDEWNRVKLNGSYQTAVIEAYLQYFIAFPREKAFTLYVPSNHKTFYENELWGRALYRLGSNKVIKEY